MTYKGEENERYDHLLPLNEKVTKVTIYYYYKILGFRFWLSAGSIWDIGRVGSGYMKTQTIDIDENEVIVGFKAKSDSNILAEYTEW